MIRWSLLTVLGVVTAVFGTILIASYVFAGAAGVVVTAVYLFALLLPGAVVYFALVARFHEGRSGIIATVFFSNLLGMALLQGSAWLLARSAVFSFWNTVGLEAAVAATAVVLCWRSVSRLCLDGLSNRFVLHRDETVYLAIIVSFGFLILLPVLWLYWQGFLIGGDTSTLAWVGSHDAHAGAWLPLSQVWYPGAPAGGLAPGVPIIYAVLAAATGTSPAAFAGPIELLPLILTTLAVYLLVQRFSDHPLILYSLPLVWAVGAFADGQFFSNNMLLGDYANVFPDSLFSLVGLVGALVLLVDLLRGKGPQWLEVILLSAAIVVASLDDQLTFLILAAAVALFGLEILWARGLRWSLPRFAVSIAPIFILLPPYLLPGNQGPSSPLLIYSGEGFLSDLVAFQPRFIEEASGVLGGIAMVVVALAIALVLYRWARSRRRGVPSSPPSGVLVLAALGALALYLTLTPIGYDILGIQTVRFDEFVGIAWVGVVAFGLDWLVHLRIPRLARKTVVASVVVILLVSGSAGIVSNLNYASAISQPKWLSTPELREAGEWFSAHAIPGAVAVGDENGGNTGILAFGDYDGNHLFYTRARADLYAEIYLTTSPYNLSAYYANLVLRTPTEPNAAAAAQALMMDYYVFQRGASDYEIQAFALLPYFSLVYSNSAVDIFQYVGGTGPGFIPAVNYCALSPGLVAYYYYNAYSVVIDLPQMTNSISSTISGLTGASVSYCLSIPASGSYTVWVHRWIFQTTEFLNVSVDGGLEGQVYYSNTGSALGSPLEMTLPEGNVTLTLTVEGTVGAVDPIDYLVVAPT